MRRASGGGGRGRGGRAASRIYHTGWELYKPPKLLRSGPWRVGRSGVAVSPRLNPGSICDLTGGLEQFLGLPVLIPQKSQPSGVKVRGRLDPPKTLALTPPTYQPPFPALRMPLMLGLCGGHHRHVGATQGSCEMGPAWVGANGGWGEAPLGMLGAFLGRGLSIDIEVPAHRLEIACMHKAQKSYMTKKCMAAVKESGPTPQSVHLCVH
jgi:hypothetical protein